MAPYGLNPSPQQRQYHGEICSQQRDERLANSPRAHHLGTVYRVLFCNALKTIGKNLQNNTYGINQDALQSGTRYDEQSPT